MRLHLLVVASILAFSFLTLVPEAEARWVYCTELKGSCDGLVCYDSNLNGRYDQSDECIRYYCPMGGCCYGAPCPPPQDY